MNKEIRDTMNILFETTNKREEQAKSCFNPVNWKVFVMSINGNSLVNKYPRYKASDFISKTLFSKILDVIKEMKLKVIDEKYDDYNWYCIFGNYNKNVTKIFDIDKFIDESKWIKSYGTRYIGEQYYYIYASDNCIVGKCSLSEEKYRWILLADQNVFDNLNISITR